MGEIDPLGTRKDGLDVFLDQKVEEGYTIETRTDTHAIIARRPKGLKRFTSGADPGRYVVEVDEDGIAKMRPAEPRRAWSDSPPREERTVNGEQGQEYEEEHGEEARSEDAQGETAGEEGQEVSGRASSGPVRARIRRRHGAR